MALRGNIFSFLAVLMGACSGDGSGAFASATAPHNISKFRLALPDSSRNGRLVEAQICMPFIDVRCMRSRHSLYVFAHGGGLFAEDYEYICDAVVSDIAVARLISPAGDPPMDLQLMAQDILFLAAELPYQSSMNGSSPLVGCLSGEVVLSGHSMGGAAAILAAASSAPNRHEKGEPNILAIGVMAPGFWGDAQTSLLQASGCSLAKVPLLLLVGDQDCANSLAAQALPIWRNVTAPTCGPHTRGPRFLVDLHGATHCQWATTVKGTCVFDKPCVMPRLERAVQQQRGLQLLFNLATRTVEQALDAGDGLWSYISERSPPSAAAALRSLCPCGGIDLTV